MLRALLLLAVCISLNLVCFGQNKPHINQPTSKLNSFLVGDDFKGSDLFNYIYAFSTADSNLSVLDVAAQKNNFSLISRQIPHFGSDNRYHWMITEIKNTGTQARQLVSYMHFNEMTDLCFYITDEDNQVIYQQQHFSQRTYVNKKPIINRYFAFPVDLPVRERLTIYWRVYRAENSVVTPVRLYTKDSFDSFLQFYESLTYVCLGVIMSAFLLSLILYFATRLKVLFYYAGYCLSYFLLCISNDGIILQYFHIDPFEIALGTRLLLTGLLIFFLVQFSMYFLNARKLFSKWFITVNGFIGYIALISGIVIPVFSLPERFSSSFYFVCTVGMLSVLIMIGLGMVYKKRAAFIYFIAAGPFFISSVWYGLTILFDTPVTWFFYMSNTVIPIIEMVVLGVELGNRLIRERNHYFSGIRSLQIELTSSILKTQEMERRRIAADLHDDLGGTLATIRLKFASMKQSLSQKADPQQPALQVMEDIEPLIQQSSHELRRISQKLMPAEFERIGLVASVAHLVHTASGKAGQFAFLTAGKQRALSLEKELAVYRISEDALQNLSRRPLTRRGSLQILFDDRLRVVLEAEEVIESISETESNIRKELSISSLLTTHLVGEFTLEVSQSGILIMAEIPY